MSHCLIKSDVCKYLKLFFINDISELNFGERTGNQQNSITSAHNVSSQKLSIQHNLIACKEAKTKLDGGTWKPKIFLMAKLPNLVFLKIFPLFLQ